MPTQIIANLLNIKNLKLKLQSLEKTGMYEAISHKMLDDIRSLDWAIGELTRIHFTPVILCVSKSLPIIQDLKGVGDNDDNIVIDDVAMFVWISPSKVEATVWNKYFIPDGVCGTKMKIEDNPPYLICDGYELKDGLIFIEGSILNTHLAEIGKKGIKEQLLAWSRKLLETKGKGEKA
jgi:hypothetical protein